MTDALPTITLDQGVVDRLIARFREHYPSFDDPRYQNDERFYKDHFSARLRELLSRERLNELITAGNFEEAYSLVKQSISGSVKLPEGGSQQNNLLNQWDRLPILDATPEQLVRRLYDLLYGEGPFDTRFDAWVNVLAAKKPGVWPAATYFLMLLDPAIYIFVKPSFWQLFLKEAGDTAKWPTRPNAAFYSQIQGYAQSLQQALRDLHPGDLIDVQSFLWRLNYTGDTNTSHTWIFQANPEYYDLTNALAELDVMTWRVSRYADRIAVGDVVYLWESGSDAGIVASTRVISEPDILEDDEAEQRFYREHGHTGNAERRVRLQIESVLLERISRDEVRNIPALENLSIIKNAQGTNFVVTNEEAQALAALVEADDLAEDVGFDNDEFSTDIATWRAGISSQHPLVVKALDNYPEWLRTTFGEQIELRLSRVRPEIGVFISGRWQHYVSFNAVKNGLYVLIAGLTPDEMQLLRERLSRPETLRERAYASKVGQRFYAETDQDYELLKDVVTRTVTRALAAELTAPPDPLDGPAYVVIHSANGPDQRLGETYTYSNYAGGAHKKLTDALIAWRDNSGQPVYLVIYRPAPYYSFAGWARVKQVETSPGSKTNETRYTLHYEWHPFPLLVSARNLSNQISWLNKGLAVAFRGMSIRRISAEVVRTIVLHAYINGRTMTFADAAFTVLSRDIETPLPLAELLETILAENLIEARGQTPQLTLSSALSRDERFRNLGGNVWALADSEDDELNDSPEPVTREPEIYAESDAQFIRIHFPRPLWPAARAYGVIGIGWPIDSVNQSVKRFRKIRPGDRIVSYVQGGVIGGIGIATSAFDPENPRAGLPEDIEGNEFALCLRVAWADAPNDQVDILDALRHPVFTQLYNRIKNPHTVMPLPREDYIALLSLLQVDDAGAPASESRLPNALPQLHSYVTMARALGSGDFEAQALVDAARSLTPPAAEPLDTEDLVTEFSQFRLLNDLGNSRYQVRTYVAGSETALMRLMALALLVPVEGSAEIFDLPSERIVPRLRAATEQTDGRRFAPELGADGLTLLSWYAEAGLVIVDGDTWQTNEEALEPLSGDDEATRVCNTFLDTLLARVDGTLRTDLVPVAANASLPTVTEFEARLQELGHDLLFDPAIVRRIYRSLIAGRHVVLSGPPGTGKTELARLLPTLLWREAPVHFNRLPLALNLPPVEQAEEQRHGYAPIVVTATEDWGIRDVIGGIGPRLDGQSGEVRYAIEYGALTRTILHHYEGSDGGRRLPTGSVFNRRDYRHEDRRRYRGVWLVIDEFTRAPIDAAFGSLLTTLSGGEHARLSIPGASGEQREIPMPRDFRIIGTLNSFDRHFLNQISEAMKRRFDFIDVLPPSPRYAEYEQGIAALQALRRLRAGGFEQIIVEGEPPSYRWPGVVAAVPTTDEAGLRRYQRRAEDPAVETALTDFWRIFSAIRVFRQLGTAQIVAVYLNLLAGSLVGMDWAEALDTALADTLADQLQVLNRDELQIIEAYLQHAGMAHTFSEALRTILARVPLGRRPALRAALREADQQRSASQSSDISLDETPLTEEQIGRVFTLGASLALPPISIFRRRLRDLTGERGL